MVAEKIFSTNKGAPVALEKGEKNASKDRFSKEQARNQKEQKGNGRKCKEKGVYKGQNKLYPKELVDRYRKERRCFKCGEQGHNYQQCPSKNGKKDAPEATNILSSKDVDGEASQLCYVWGKVRDQSALILLDPGSTHIFISIDLAQRLGSSTNEMGPALDAREAFKGQEVPVTPLIGKLCIHMQAYMDSEEFYVSPLLHQDVILGAPWFHRMYARL